MKQSSFLFRLMPLVLAALIIPLQAAQDSVQTSKKPAVAKSQANPPAKAIAGPVDTGAKTEKLENTVPASQAENGTSVEKLRQEAARLKAEAKVLRDMADTLNRSSDDAEKKADEAKEKAELIEDEFRETDAQHVAQHVKMEIEKIKRIIQADVERLKRLHGVKTSNDTNYAMQADSLDSVLAHLSVDTSQSIEKQKQLVQEIHDNSQELLAKSREMSSKARELEGAADKREDLAEARPSVSARPVRDLFGDAPSRRRSAGHHAVCATDAAGHPLRNHGRALGEARLLPYKAAAARRRCRRVDAGPRGMQSPGKRERRAFSLRV